MKSNLPFLEQKINLNTFIRKFSSSHFSELEWHQDAENRIIEVISGNGWCIQVDNEIPQTLKKGQQYFVPKETLHRLIAGPNELVIKLTKLFN